MFPIDLSNIHGQFIQQHNKYLTVQRPDTTEFQEYFIVEDMNPFELNKLKMEGSFNANSGVPKIFIVKFSSEISDGYLVQFDGWWHKLGARSGAYHTQARKAFTGTRFRNA